MTDEHGTLRKIEWSETLPFLRLFRTFKRAASFQAITLAFACVLATYVVGRIMDLVWLEFDAGVTVAKSTTADPRVPRLGRESGRALPSAAAWTAGPRNEIEAFAVLNAEEFRAWTEEKRAYRDQARAAAENPEMLLTKTQIGGKLALLNERVKRGLREIGERKELDRPAQTERRRELRRAADCLYMTIAGYDAAGLAPGVTESEALALVLAAGRPEGGIEAATELREFREFLNRCRIKGEYEQLRQRGPFMGLLDFEMKCFAGAIQGACAGRLGFSGSALSAEPAMLGSIVSAGSGIFWLATQRPCYFAIFALVLLLLHAYFGGAICRAAAVRIAREEGLSARKALSFSREKYLGLIAAPLLPAVAFLAIGAVIWVGGLIGAIPGLHLIPGLFYGLTLIGGLFLGLILIFMTTGFHLMWPTVAVEGSDAFDGIQRAFGYVMQRPWHTAFYSIVLLIYGAFTFVFVRLLALLTFKLSHTFIGGGMNLAENATVSAAGKLDALWRMPAWQDLPLLPSTGDTAFWGAFANAPLTGYEAVTMFFFALWVFIVVGLVGGFVVSFYYCGGVEMYFLLRRTVDGVDFDEIYYEEPEDDLDEDFNQPASIETASEPKPAEDKPAE